VPQLHPFFRAMNTSLPPAIDERFASPLLIEWSALFDWSALAIVLGGTLVATVVRCGRFDLALACAHAWGLVRTGFDADANRAAIARWAHAIRQSGVLGADESLPPDADLAAAIAAMVRAGSPHTLEETHAAALQTSREQSARAARVFEQAGELAPVFGMVGTLFSMTQIAPGVASGEASLAAIGMAVLSSLYGVLAAHMVFLPIAAGIARRHDVRETESLRLVRWLAGQIAVGLRPAKAARSAQVTRLKPAA